MNLFTKSTPQLDKSKLKQIKDWVYQKLDLETEITISLNQLQCSEPGCPPFETVILVMTTPPQQYKIHKPAFQITEQDIQQL